LLNQTRRKDPNSKFQDPEKDREKIQTSSSKIQRRSKYQDPAEKSAQLGRRGQNNPFAA
jgi:hypothetical protein